MKTHTPCCKRSVQLPDTNHATLVCDRTCRKCRTAWRVVIRPRVAIDVGGAIGSFINVVDWTVKP